MIIIIINRIFTFINLLNLVNSYVNTVFIDSLYLTGYNFITSSILYYSGKSFIIVSITFYNNYSIPAPSAPAPLSLQDNKESNSKFVSFKFFVMSAFGWKPNTSGL